MLKATEIGVTLFSHRDARGSLTSNLKNWISQYSSLSLTSEETGKARQKPIARFDEVSDSESIETSVSAEEAAIHALKIGADLCIDFLGFLLNDTASYSNPYARLDTKKQSLQPDWMQHFLPLMVFEALITILTDVQRFCATTRYLYNLQRLPLNDLDDADYRGSYILIKQHNKSPTLSYISIMGVVETVSIDNFAVFDNLSYEALGNRVLLDAAQINTLIVQNGSASRVDFNILKASVEQYQNQLLQHFSLLKPHLEKDFSRKLSKAGVNAYDHQKRYTAEFLEALKHYLPLTPREFNTSYYSDQTKINVHSIDEYMVRLQMCASAAQNCYDRVLAPITAKKDEYEKEILDNRTRKLDQLIKRKKIPHAYQGYTFDRLFDWGGAVDLNASENKTGSNLALIALQYNNPGTYKRFFTGRDVLRNQRNKKGLSAADYEVAQLWSLWPEWTLSSSTQEVRGIIEEKDASGGILRVMEQYLRAYLEVWHSRKSVITHDPWLDDNSLFAALINLLCNARNEFNTREEKARGYLMEITNYQNGNVSRETSIVDALTKLLKDHNTSSGGLRSAIDKAVQKMCHEHKYHELLSRTPPELLIEWGRVNEENKLLKAENAALIEENKRLKRQSSNGLDGATVEDVVVVVDVQEMANESLGLRPGSF